MGEDGGNAAIWVDGRVGFGTPRCCDSPYMFGTRTLWDSFQVCELVVA